MTLSDIQKGRFSRGAIVYNTNNNNYAVVLNGREGEENDPCSLILEFAKDNVFLNTPPNRALIPTGRFLNIDDLIKKISKC